MGWLIRFFVKQGVFAELLTVIVLVLGVGSVYLIQREAFPNVQYDAIMITTIYPGAAAEEVERLITNVLEQDLKEVDGIKRMQSVSTESRSLIFLQLDPDQTTEAEAKEDVQQVVDQFTGLPDGAERPMVAALETRQMPIMEVGLSGGANEMELRASAKALERVIEDIPEVAKVQFNGLRDLEIRVEADLDKLARYEISLEELVRAISLQNISIPGGSFREQLSGSKSQEVVIRTIGEFHTIEDILQTVVRANDLGKAIRLRDLATVTEVLEKANERYRANGKNAISLTVIKKEKADAINLVDKLKLEVDRFVSQSSTKLDVSYVNDSSIFIRRRLSVLSSNLVIGLILVFVILSLALPARIAVLTSLGIPFSFLGTMIFFHTQGVTLNLISMVGLIIVSGMLVDDAIVVTDNVVRRMREGESPKEAAIKGTEEVWAPIVASVLTTVVAFAPLMVMTGITGKVVKFLPIGVIVALLVSVVECFFILPHHISVFLPARLSSRPKSKISAAIEWFWDHWLQGAYKRVLSVLLRRRYWVALVVLMLFIGTLFLARFGMRFILFPGDDIDAFLINAKAPVGTALEATQELMRPIEQAVQKLPKEELLNYTTKVGIRSLGMLDPNSVRGSHYGQVVVFLSPATERKRVAQQIIDQLKQELQLPDGLEQINFLRINPGPPVGKPIYLGVRGVEYEQIMKVVGELKAQINKINGVIDLQDNYAIGTQEVRVRVNAAEAAAAGLNVGAIGSTLRTAYEGKIASSIRTLEEEVDIRVTIPENERRDPAHLGQLRIPDGRGNLIRLGEVATSERSQGLAAYEHENNWRQVTITGDVNEKVTDSKTVNEIIRKKLVPEMRKNYPNIDFAFGGEDQDTKESFASLQRAFFVAGLGILAILILIFQNLWQPLLIALTIPMGVMAVIWTFYIHDRPLSFLATMGIIALGGVIVNNAIVLVAFVNNLRKEGKGELESIEMASGMRLRPIFLTTVTTVAGLLPTAYGWGGLDTFIVPIALALGWGLAFGSILTTIVFPPFLAINDDMRRAAGRLFGRLFGKSSH